ncbi:hypothetical protein QZH41_006515 [Actinostola sp. cb2023]|nr:hypothetical protein QZH41_006515 [Actinostola sp. cb2023]
MYPFIVKNRIYQGAIFKDCHDNDIAAIKNVYNFALGDLLVLPQTFGNIFLGETFSSYISVHNDSNQTVKDIVIKVLKPLDVKTKFYNGEDDSLFLEAQVQNITSSPMVMESVRLEPSPLYNVTDLNLVNADNNQVNRLKVRVSDSAIYPHRLYNTTIVSISVLDMNDNPPEFSNIFDNASIAENSPSGTLVTRVTATDSDHDANARISYTLSHASVANDYFRIDAITGEIFVRNALDYERKTHDVIVTVTAKDAGLPSLAGSMKLRIDLIDLNDNAPVIESTFYEAEIRSDRTFGPPAILTLNGTDKDSGNNGKLTYELENQQENFMLDPDTVCHYPQGHTQQW